MTRQEILVVLNQIEEWIASLQDQELGEKCRTSGKSFFEFMVQRGQHPGYLAKKIQAVTGYNPKQLYSANDAALLRDAIFRYEASQATVEHGVQTPRQSVDHFWGD